MHTMEAPTPPLISYLFIVWQSAIHKRNVSKTSLKRMNTIHKFYGKRGAEKLLGIAPYTLDQVAARHPLPSTEFTCDGLPIYTKEQLQDWYEERPRHGATENQMLSKKLQAIEKSNHETPQN